ncbi:lipoyl synthase [Candidatus Micrarchaeota archaeon]|nr:lipoyl synthase [Candidatus Micrarchaeota archaeon]
MSGHQKKPDWFRIRYQKNEQSEKVSGLMERLHLNSVCQSAHCPNRPECWGEGTASFMILGEYCTRGCRFCAVKTRNNPPPPDPEEPGHLANAVSSLNLKYVVITSVTRDDLEDGGAAHFSECVSQVRKKNPGTLVETLIPDFGGRESPLKTVADSEPDVISHNVETVERLIPGVRDARAGYRSSLGVLRNARGISNGRIITKSGLMVGLGEAGEEVRKTMMDLLDAGVEILTIGQYLRPTPRHLPVEEFVAPQKFSDYRQMAYGLGFRYVASGPLVRSSYKAGEPFIKNLLHSRISR